MIETNVTKVRDPFVLVDDNAYYLYKYLREEHP